MAKLNSSDSKALYPYIPGLWPHQVDAVAIARKYFRSFKRLFADSNETQSALIRMPTGTGKTGVIGILARCFSDINNVLIICPWSALRNQLVKDIDTRFWKRSRCPNPPPKQIKELLPSTSTEILDQCSEEPTIFIATIQALQTIYRDDQTTYDCLRSRASLLIVDEGHREPAPLWAEAVRELHTPTVLFTATPYRNDHKLFNVHPKHVFSYTHQSAISDKYIREVEFHEFSGSRTPKDFVGELLSYFNRDFRNTSPSDIDKPRAIIRCSTSDEINHIATLISEANESVVAVHERFKPKDSEDYLQKDTPDPEKIEATFWVHQHKLIEGLDDPRFSLLAIYRPFRNARALVQQIGRILRNPNQKPNQKSVVISYRQDRQQAYWNGYRGYERIFSENPDKFEARQLFDTIIQVQPEYQYFEGNYRERFSFDISKGALHLELSYPLKTNVYYPVNDFKMEVLSMELKKEWVKLDKDIRISETPDKDTQIHIYQTYRNSPALLEQSLVEFSIGFSFIRKVRNLLFYYDTAGNTPEYLLAYSSRVEPSKLQRIFSGKEARVGSISLMNSDLGSHSIRRKLISSRSIANTAPSLSDHAHFYTTILGHIGPREGEVRRRYVGFTRSRISDPGTSRVNYDEYIRWISLIAKQIQSGRSSIKPLLSRYASFTSEPSETQPLNILIDMEDTLSDFISIERKSISIEFDETCYPIENGEFTCIANGNEYEVKIKYEKGNSTYKLTAPDLERAFVRQHPITGTIQETIVSYLNKKQAFRIVTGTPGVVFAHGRFYKPKLPLWSESSSDSLDLLSVFLTDEKLTNVESEKGKQCPSDGSGWDTDSVFYLIDNIGKPEGIAQDLSVIDLLVCDDMGTELADFIAGSNSERRVCFIHAKTGKVPGSTSATSFQDVCSQAMKNLVWLHPFSQSDSPNINRWINPWSLEGVGFVQDRIRRGPSEPTQLWDNFSNLIRDPMTSREVWIVLGKGFSLSAFESERLSNNPRPHIVQLFFLLQSTWAAVSSVGATLKVFCGP